MLAENLLRLERVFDSPYWVIKKNRRREKGAGGGGGRMGRGKNKISLFSSNMQRHDQKFCSLNQNIKKNLIFPKLCENIFFFLFWELNGAHTQSTPPPGLWKMSRFGGKEKGFDFPQRKNFLAFSRGVRTPRKIISRAWEKSLKKKKKKRSFYCTFSSAIWSAIASSPLQFLTFFFLKNFWLPFEKLLVLLYAGRE